MNTRYFWNEIKKHFHGEWVELIDFEWDWSSSHPAWARIRYHASDRKELMSLIDTAGAHDGAVILFIGNGHSFVSHESAGAAL